MEFVAEGRRAKMGERVRQLEAAVAEQQRLNEDLAQELKQTKRQRAGKPKKRGKTPAHSASESGSDESDVEEAAEARGLPRGVLPEVRHSIRFERVLLYGKGAAPCFGIWDRTFFEFLKAPEISDRFG
jgi:hypothetical protein